MKITNDPIQRVYTYLLEKAAKRAERFTATPPLRFRPSEIGGCKREIFYRLSGKKPRAVSGETQLLFMDGEVHHNVIRQLMREAGVTLGDLVFGPEGEIEETGGTLRVLTHTLGEKTYDVQLSGRSDGSVDVGEGAAAMPLLEIKTVGRFKFYEFERAYLKGGEKSVLKLLRDDVKKKAGAKPHPEHANRRIWYQFQATLLLVDQPYICVQFKNRDKCELGLLGEDGLRHSVLIAADPDVQQDVLARCAVVLRALETGVAPMAEFMDGSMSCKMCNFYQYCWGATKKEGA